MFGTGDVVCKFCGYGASYFVLVIFKKSFRCIAKRMLSKCG